MRRRNSPVPRGFETMQPAFCAACVPCRVRSARQRGFTLIEAMVVIAISAILMAMAVPSMRQLIESNGVANSVNGFVGSLSFARSEALKRGVSVTMCRSSDAQAASPTCENAQDWQAGWIVFVDFNADGKRNAADGETVLRVQGSLERYGAVNQNENGVAIPSLRFDATGLMRTGASGFTFLPPSGATTSRRVACVNITGRTRLIAHPTESCS
ncbi:MAG: GspH/FimT family pseudopilin [Variovorax sp.]